MQFKLYYLFITIILTDTIFHKYYTSNLYSNALENLKILICILFRADLSLGDNKLHIQDQIKYAHRLFEYLNEFILKEFRDFKMLSNSDKNHIFNSKVMYLLYSFS